MDAQSDYRRAGHFIYTFYRLGLTPERLRMQALPGQPELNARAAALADRFDELVSGGGWVQATDEQLGAVLDEARNLCGALDGF